MICEICKDIEFLQRRAKTVTKEEAAELAQNLLDTLQAHRGGCVGMAANMIGVAKAAIIVNVAAGEDNTAAPQIGLAASGYEPEVMFNPKPVKASPQTYQTEEGCLSLTGQRPVVRHQWIEIAYRNSRWQKKRQRFTGFVAEIIQHELDHLDGKLI